MDFPQDSGEVRGGQGRSGPTVHFDALRHHLEPHHPVVVDVALFQLLFVEVQDEGQVVVQIKLRGGGKEMLG